VYLTAYLLTLDA
jgi:hypothetical protein